MKKYGKCFIFCPRPSSFFSRSQIATLKNEDNRGQNIKYLPYAFTEQGVAMLSGVLKSETAIQMSIQIMNAFVAMHRSKTWGRNVLRLKFWIKH